MTQSIVRVALFSAVGVAIAAVLGCTEEGSNMNDRDENPNENQNVVGDEELDQVSGGLSVNEMRGGNPGSGMNAAVRGGARPRGKKKTPGQKFGAWIKAIR